MLNLDNIVLCVTFAIVVIGILGNLLSFIVFLKHTSSVNTLLAALSLVDLCLLVFTIPVFILPHLEAVGHVLYVHVLNYLYPVNLMMQTCSIYIMVLITMERWTAVCRPLQVRIWCTARSTRQALAGVIVFAFVYNIVRFYEYNVDYIVSDNGTYVTYGINLRNFTTHPHYMFGYYTGLYLLTHFLIPFGVFIIMNGHVCKSIIKLRRARLMLTRQQQREQSTTLMLLVVTLTFAVCNTLPFLLNLAECWNHELFKDEYRDIAYQVNDLSNSLVAFNSATTFIVYFAFSEKYRHTAARILLRCCYTFPKDVKYNSLQSRTPSFRANSLYGVNSSFRDGSCRLKYSTSTSTELFLRPVSRTERASSEYNDRIKRLSPAVTKLSATSLALPSSTTMVIGRESNSIKEKRNKFRLARKHRAVSTHTFGPMPKRSCTLGTTYRQSSQPLPLNSGKGAPVIVEQRRISDCLPSKERTPSSASAVIVTVRSPSTEPPSKAEPETASTTLDLAEDIETLPLNMSIDMNSITNSADPMPMTPILDNSHSSENAPEDSDTNTGESTIVD